ncbi:MAG: ABC transporter permease [Acidimicrobiia bacterium]|nr:ABC transporter permease [Acidimicrobiia bacterium]
MEGYRAPDAGRVRVLGLDPVADRARLLPHLGVMLQDGGVYTASRPPEVLRLFAAYYDDPLDPDQLLARVGLADRRRTTWRNLSGGERQRLALALAIVGRPRVAVLDEPTSGIDPAGRTAIREVVTDLREDGVCVVLTTHDLDEAERLADHVVIIDRGRVVSAGTPADLTTGDGDDHLLFGGPRDLDLRALGDAVGTTVREVATGETGWRLRPHPPWWRHSPPGSPSTTWPSTTSGPGASGSRTSSSGSRPPTRVPGPRPTMRTPPTTMPGGRRRMRPYLAQTGLELRLTLRQGEQLLVSLGIPLLLLVFFSRVEVLPVDTDEPIDFLAPGILALAVMSTAMVSLGISTGFERHYRVLKRLGTTPLGRPRLLAAKATVVLVVLAVQVGVLVPVALALGWGASWSAGLALGGVLLGVAAFAGLGLFLAGTLPGTVNLAVTNGLYLVLLLLGGMIILEELPPILAAVARALPAAALAEVLGGALRPGQDVAVGSLAVLATWSVAAPVLAALTFRWE